MIAGRIADANKQQSILPAAVVRALAAVQKVDPLKLEPGKYEVEGDKLFYLVQDVELRTMEESRAEAHRQYADIQIPCSTNERYGFALPQPELPIADDQLQEKDLAFFPTPVGESFINITPGMYLVFLPNELHRPCLAIGKKEIIRKVVMKVHSSLLGL